MSFIGVDSLTEVEVVTVVFNTCSVLIISVLVKLFADGGIDNAALGGSCLLDNVNAVLKGYFDSACGIVYVAE